MPLETIKVEEVDDPKLPLANIAKPTNLDVLCGRGVARNRHVGNENFRAVGFFVFNVLFKYLYTI